MSSAKVGIRDGCVKYCNAISKIVSPAFEGVLNLEVVSPPIPGDPNATVPSCRFGISGAGKSSLRMNQSEFFYQWVHRNRGGCNIALRSCDGRRHCYRQWFYVDFSSRC